MEEITSPNGNRATVLYSLGNFISAQVVEPIWWVRAQIEVEKDPSTEKITIHPPQLQPVITCYQSGYAQLHLLPFCDYTGELGDQRGQPLSRDYIRQLVSSVVDPAFLTGGALD